MKKGVIYVICPIWGKTGGADALHQLVYYLNQLNYKASIVYKVDNYYDKPVTTLNRFKIYVDSFILEKDIIDAPENTIVLPESYTQDRLKYKYAKLFIWWLSVDNNLTSSFWKKNLFYATLPLRIIKNWKYYKGNVLSILHKVSNKEKYSFNKESNRITHLCASYYAFHYVSYRSRNKITKCIEPISKQFLNVYESEKEKISIHNRLNIILYNPVRKYENILKKISKYAPELQFEPLQGLTQPQLIEKYKTSKLYIDFGAFPGAERIPKEAVLFGCAIITGRRGASDFHGDVPIPDEYKFENPKEQISEIVAKIRHILDNYENVYSDFDEYRKTVLNLEENFKKALCEIFN